MEHLRRGAVEHQCFGEGLFWVEAGGILRGPSGDGACAGKDSGDGRRYRSQYFHQDISLLLRAVRLRRGSGRSARDRTVPQLVLVQYLRNFVVVARHSGAVVDLLRQEAVQEDSARNGCRRTVRRRNAEVAYASALV